MEAIVQVITTVGFPIAMCLVMGYYVKYTHDDHRKDIQRLQDAHKEEMNSLSTALNNNTLVMQKLIDKLESDEK